MSELTIATIIFVATYAVIINERLDRSVVALTGGALMIAIGVLDQQRAPLASRPSILDARTRQSS